MVEVARGGGTGESIPMLLRVPAITDILGSERVLGFGDVRPFRRVSLFILL